MIIDLLYEVASRKNVRLILEDEKQKTASLVLTDTKSPAAFEAHIASRLLGTDTGRDVLLNIGGQLEALRATQKDLHRQLTPKELERLREIQLRFETHGDSVPMPLGFIALAPE